jgi:tetratricopeptide (TPR) repeat protein
VGDRAAEADLLLTEATVLDWAEKYGESARRVEEAQPLVAALADPVLEARCYNGLARQAFRRERMPEAVSLFIQATTLAERHGDHETRIMALLLMAHALIVTNRIDEAAARFDEVIGLCERTGDRLHLCAAYSNRVYMHSVKKSVSGTMGDLLRAVELAREVGQPIAERVAAHNLAEFLHWSGRHAEALVLARRSYALQRFLPQPVPPDALLLARIHAALGDLAEVRELLGQVHDMSTSDPLSQTQELVVAMLELVVGAASETAWAALCARARPLMPGEEYLEILYFRARAMLAQRSGVAAVLAMARPLLDEHPVWHEPFAALDPA